MANNKVVYFGETLIDLTEDTVTPETLAEGVIAHDASGKVIVGSMKMFDATVYDLPVLYLTGDTSAMTKDVKVTLDYVYGDLSGTCTCKWQGATSINYEKKNYTIVFDKAFEAKDGWGSQSKYCLKANFIDSSHSRNVVSCILWGMIVKSRSTVPTELANLVNGGAIDGFPCVIMLNGEFHGLYTFNIPKDGWMFGLVEDTTKTQAVVSAHQHTTATQFKGEVVGDESDFELEFVSNKNNTSWVNTSLNRLINACVNSWGGDLDNVVGQYLDWDSAIDYLIHVVVEKGTDAVDKNFLLTTFNGTKWYFTNYDRDTTYGLVWDGSAVDRPVSNCSFDECADTSRVFELIKRFKTDALKARYKQLRGNVLSESRIYQKFENFAWAIPSPVALEDVKTHPTILGSSVNGVDQICRWIRQRLLIVDNWINALPEQEVPVEPSEGYTNLVPTSIDTDGSIYNGVGYKDDTRLSSSGGVSGTPQTGSATTGFIELTDKCIIRIKGATFFGTSGHCYINFYNESKGFVFGASRDAIVSELTKISGNYEYDETTGVTNIDFSTISNSSEWGANIANSKYFRLNAYGKGADLIVTLNEEIV